MTKPYYPVTEQHALEKVAAVFEAYIKNSPYVELLYSQKIGYVYLYIDQTSPEGHEGGLAPAYIESAEELCSLLLSEIAFDVINTFKKDHTLCEADAEERLAIEKSLEPYLKQLPGYRYLLDELFAPLF